MITQEDVNKVITRECTVMDLVRQGKMELIDVNEELNLHIALRATDL